MCANKIIPAKPEDLKYITSLAKQDMEAIGFIPKGRYETVLNSNQTNETLYIYKENNQPIGFCYAGHNQQGIMRVHQVYVQEDARRELRATELVNTSPHPRDTHIILKCAEELEANQFWRSLGFHKIKTFPPTNQRKRKIHVYQKQIKKLLF